MASSSSFNNFPRCGICNQQFTGPKQLPCYHNFCRTCLADFATGSGTLGADNSFPCPTCRKLAIPDYISSERTANIADSFPDNLFIASLMQVQNLQNGQAPQRVQCTFHTQSEVVYYCCECEVPVCETCKGTIHATCDVEQLSLEKTDGLYKQHKNALQNEMKDTIAKMTNLVESIGPKQIQLLEKKELTAINIEHYFTSLRHKINRELIQQQSAIQELLAETANKEEESIKEDVDLCSSILRTLRNNGTVLESLAGKVGNNVHAPARGQTVAHLLVIEQARHQLNELKGIASEVELENKEERVYKFLIDHEAERKFLSTRLGKLEMKHVHNSVMRNNWIDNTVLEPGPDIHLNTTLDNNGPKARESEDASPPAYSASPSVTASHSDRGRTRRDPDVNDRNHVDARHGITTHPRESRHIVQPTMYDVNDPPPPYPGLPEGGGSVLPHTSTNSASTTPQQPRRHVVGGASTTPQQARRHVVGPPHSNTPRTTSAGSPAIAENRSSAIAENRSSAIAENRQPTAAAPTVPPRIPAQLQPPAPPTGGAGAISPRNSQARPPRTPMISVGYVEKFSSKAPDDFTSRSSAINGIIWCGSYSGYNLLLLVDRWNAKVKFIYESGIIVSSLTFNRAEPSDVTKVTDRTFAVTLPTKKEIHTVFLKNGNVQRPAAKDCIKTPSAYTCIAYIHEDQTYVCGQVPATARGQAEVDIINLQGKLLKIIKEDIGGAFPIFAYPRFLAVFDNGTIVVSDWRRKCLTFVDLHGRVTAHYRGTVQNPLREPGGLTVSPGGVVFAVDTLSDRIHIVTQKGESVQVLYPEIQSPKQLCYIPGSLGNKLAVTDSSGTVHVVFLREE